MKYLGFYESLTPGLIRLALEVHPKKDILLPILLKVHKQPDIEALAEHLSKNLHKYAGGFKSRLFLPFEYRGSLTPDFSNTILKPFYDILEPLVRRIYG